jgi:hypothetical protein
MRIKPTLDFDDVNQIQAIAESLAIGRECARLGGTVLESSLGGSGEVVRPCMPSFSAEFAPNGRWWSKIIQCNPSG